MKRRTSKNFILHSSTSSAGWSSAPSRCDRSPRQACVRHGRWTRDRARHGGVAGASGRRGRRRVSEPEGGRRRDDPRDGGGGGGGAPCRRDSGGPGRPGGRPPWGHGRGGGERGARRARAG